MSLPEIYYTKQVQSRQTAEDIVNHANKEADNIKKEKLLEAKRKPNFKRTSRK